MAWREPRRGPAALQPRDEGEVVDYALEHAALTDIGTSRPNNEDASGCVAEGDACALVAVADGVSLGQAGEVASELAIATSTTAPWRCRSCAGCPPR